MGNLFGSPKLTDFQREKLKHEFDTFYDLNGDGSLTWKDFEIAKEHACKLNGWAVGSTKETSCTEVFRDIWETLVRVADKDSDGSINIEEWLKMWEATYKKLYEDRKKAQGLPKVDDLPMWCYRYILHRFHLYDRTGDGVIDVDEFEYTLSHFRVSPVHARKAFVIFSENNTKRIDFQEFCRLASQYYFSNEPADLGNFITGKLVFETANKS